VAFTQSPGGERGLGYDGVLKKNKTSFVLERVVVDSTFGVSLLLDAEE
jgi:hypothetical protein